MGDSAAPSCINAIPDAADTAFQIHRMKRSAYTAVLRSFCAQSELLSGTKEECLAELRKHLKILETEHGEYLVEARSNKQMKSLSAGMSEESTCSNEVTKDTPDLGSTVSDGDTVFQIHCLERSAYASVLRAFSAVTNYLSLLQVKLLAKLRNELRVSHIEHKEVLAKVISDEHIKSLRKFSLANYSVLMKMDAAFHAQAVVRDKIASTEQFSTSSTSCLSLAQKCSTPERLLPLRDTDILDSSSGAMEGSCLESHVAKKLRSVCELALAYLECPPSFEQFPVASYTVMAKECTDDTLDSETLSCKVKAISPIFQEKHSQSNAGQVPSCVDDHDWQESRKRKTDVPVLRGSKTRCVIDRMNGIYYEKHMNKDSNLGHGFEIFKIRLTANLLSKVKKIFKEGNPDPANLGAAKSMLKAHEKDLLDALAKLSEVSKDEAYNGQLPEVINHDEMPARLVSSTDETPPETSSPSDNTSVILQVPPPMETLPHAVVSPPSAPAELTQSSRVEVRGSLTVAPPPVPRKKWSRTKYTAEQKERMQEFTHRVGWAAQRTNPAAVDALCAQPGISRDAFVRWTYSQKRRADDGPSPRRPCVRTCYTAEQKQQRLELARRIGWGAPKTTDDSAAVEAYCAQVGISRATLLRWIYAYKFKNKRTILTPPPPPPPAGAAHE